MRRNGEPFLFVPDQISLPRDIVIECSFPSDFLQYCSRQVQCRRNTGGRGVIAPPPSRILADTLNRNFSWGQFMPLTLIVSPPPSEFSGLPTVLYACCLLPKLQTNAQKKIQHLTLLVRSFK